MHGALGAPPSKAAVRSGFLVRLPKHATHTFKTLSDDGKCINIVRTNISQKNTASRDSDGWHLCRQDF